MKILTTLISIIAVWMVGCIESPKADLGEMPLAKDIVAQVQTIQNDNNNFQVTIKPEREDGKYKVGEEIGLIFTSNRDAYVNIIDIGTSGRVRMIFPNSWHTSNRIEKGKTYRIPPKDAGFVFRVTPPTGVNYVKVIATLNKPDCVKEKYLEAKGNFFEIKDPLLAIKDIQAELRQVDPKQWTEASTQVTIEEDKPVKPAEQPLKPVEEAKPPQTAQPLKPVDAAEPAKDIVVEAQKIRNEGKAFNVKLWTQGEKTSYNAGEPVAFMFTADRDCYVTLIDIGTSGKVYRIFPNKWHESNKVEKGKTYAIPPEKSDFIFKVTAPAGTEYVKAIATLQPVTCLDNAKMEPKGAFAEIKDPGLVLKDIAMELSQQDVKTWAEANVSFNIVAAEAATPAAPSKPTVKLSTDKQVYKVGEPISFSFQCDRDCNLTLIDIGSSGKVHVIFPNAVNRDNAMKAGTVHRIPVPDKDPQLVYRIVSPPGQNTVKAICTFTPEKVLAVEIPAGQIFPFVGDRDEIIRQVREALAKLEPTHYAETEVTVQITE